MRFRNRVPGSKITGFNPLKFHFFHSCLFFWCLCKFLFSWAFFYKGLPNVLRQKSQLLFLYLAWISLFISWWLWVSYWYACGKIDIRPCLILGKLQVPIPRGIWDGGGDFLLRGRFQDQFSPKSVLRSCWGHLYMQFMLLDLAMFQWT